VKPRLVGPPSVLDALPGTRVYQPVGNAPDFRPTPA
jgi:hypothetical protein